MAEEEETELYAKVLTEFFQATTVCLAVKTHFIVS